MSCLHQPLLSKPMPDVEMEAEVAEMERELGAEAAELLRDAASPSSSASPAGLDFVAFRRKLDSVTRTCRHLGEALLALYRTLQEPAASPARLWTRPRTRACPLFGASRS